MLHKSTLIATFLLGMVTYFIYERSNIFQPVSCYVFNDKTQLWDRMRQP